MLLEIDFAKKKKKPVPAPPIATVTSILKAPVKARKKKNEHLTLSI